MPHHGKRHPAQMGPWKVEAFLSRFAAAPEVAARRRTKCSPRSCFFFYKHAGAELAVVCDSGSRQAAGPSFGGARRTEVGRRLVRSQSALWLIASLLQGAKLRPIEWLMLRVKDLDFAYRQITVRGGRGA